MSALELLLKVNPEYYFGSICWFLSRKELEDKFLLRSFEEASALASVFLLNLLLVLAIELSFNSGSTFYPSLYGKFKFSVEPNSSGILGWLSAAEGTTK